MYDEAFQICLFYLLGALLKNCQLAKDVGLTSPKATAIVRYLKLKEDIKYFKQIMIGKSKFDRYSQEAMHKIKEELPKIDIDELWEKHGHKRGDKSAT